MRRALNTCGTRQISARLGALPKRVVAVEIEPAQVQPGAQLSPEALAGLERALELVRAAVRDLR